MTTTGYRLTIVNAHCPIYCSWSRLKFDVQEIATCDSIFSVLVSYVPAPLCSHFSSDFRKSQYRVHSQLGFAPPPVATLMVVKPHCLRSAFCFSALNFFPPLLPLHLYHHFLLNRFSTSADNTNLQKQFFFSLSSYSLHDFHSHISMLRTRNSLEVFSFLWYSLLAFYNSVSFQKTLLPMQFYFSPLSLSFRLRNNLYCVRWGVKLYSIQSKLSLIFYLP